MLTHRRETASLGLSRNTEHRKVRSRSLSATLVVIGLLLIGTFAPAAAKTVIRNGYTVHIASEKIVPLWSDIQRYYWLDNERLVFLGAFVDDFRGRKSHPEYGPSMRGVFIWQREKPIKLHHQSPSVRRLCVAGKQVRYQTRSVSRKERQAGLLPIYRMGRFGEEVDVEHDYRKYRKGFMFNRHVCRHMPIVKPEGTIGGRSLHPDHGYLETRRDKTGKLSNVRYFKKDRAEPIELAIKKVDANSCVQFYPFKGAYFVYRCFGDIKSWKKNGCQNVGWLYPDGKTETTCLPAGPWLNLQVIDIVPNAKGYLITGVDSRRRARSPGGVYLISDGGYQLIEKGYVDGSYDDNQVSPDGCLVAYGYARSAKFYEDIQEGIYAVHVLDVCNRN